MSTRVVGGGARVGRRRMDLKSVPWRRLGRPRALALVLVVVAACGVLAWRLAAGGSDTESPAGKVFSNQALGVRVAYPLSWSVHGSGLVRRFVSPDRSISVVVGSPVTGALPQTVRRETEGVLRRAYSPSQLVGRSIGWIGSHRVLTSEMVGTDRSGRSIRLLSTAASTPWRTYSIVVFTTAPPPAARFLETKAILHSISFFRPAPKR